MADHVAITILRHGMTEYNLDKRYLGWTDIPLHPKGEQQLLGLKRAKVYPDGDVFLVSDLTRCKQTVELLYPDAQYIVDKGLREYHFGSWEGLTYNDLKDDPSYVDWLNHYEERAPYNGELYSVFQERVLAVWNRIIRLLENHSIHHIIVVSHGGPIRTFLSMFAPEKKNMWEWSVDFGTGYTLCGDRTLIRRGKRCTSLSVVPLMEKESGSITPIS
ncbi:histidine phosphatase family protein [Anaerobacillus sp. MEB173]|uniref:histidine phosphatase family protein n=1 Tax=Anaerobacillus sp. MEB173 TaxID=3383345 RepID=UPI003F8FA4D4